MEKVLYAKYSNQRKREFAIATIILEKDNIKHVLKRALYPKENENLKNMQMAFRSLENIFKQTSFKVAACEYVGEGLVRFDYIQGLTLEEYIRDKMSDGDFEGVCDELKRLVDELFANSYLHNFEVSDTFIDIFGERDFSHTLHAFDLSNVDMIFDNLIINDKRFVMVDYEWVFEFMIPIEFILFRSFLHSITLQSLNREQKDKILNILHVSADDMDVFNEMEFRFQNFVKGRYRDINIVYDAINNKAIPLHCMQPEKCVNSYSVVADNDIILKQNTLQSDIVIQIDDIPRCNSFTINLNCYNGIYKINNAYGIQGNKKEDLEIIDSNSSLTIINDYYFINDSPFIKYKNKNYSDIYVSFTVLTKDNAVMNTLVSSLINEDVSKRKVLELDNALMQYKAKSDEYRIAYETASGNCNEYRIAYEEVSQELLRIKSTKLWKIGEMINSVRRKKD